MHCFCRKYFCISLCINYHIYVFYPVLSVQIDSKESPHQQENQEEHQKSQRTHEPNPKRLKVDSTISPQKIRAKTEKRPCHSTRYDGLNHIMKYGTIRQRCKKEGCKAKSFGLCMKCNVHLCFRTRNCFEQFHNIHIND